MRTGWRVLAVLALAAALGAEEGEARLSLDLKDAAVVDVVQLLAEAGGWQVVFDPGLTCRLTLKLHEARWLAALEAVLRACGLGSEEEGGVLRVAPLSRLREEMAARQKLEDQRRRRPSGKLQLFRLSYARAEKMAPLLERFLSPDGQVVYDSRTNTLIVVD